MPFRRTYPNGAHLQPITLDHLDHDVLWIVLHRGNIVVQESSGAWVLPRRASPLVERLVDRHALQLGAFDAQSVLLVDLDADSPLPDDHRAVGLRDLYNRVDDEHYAVAGYATQMALWQRSANFCMRCGAPLLPLEREWGKRCSDDDCKWTMYPPVNPCTITLVHDGERALLTHKNGWGPRYGLVAGFVEPGESLEENLRREVAEEVGVQVATTEYFSSQPWPFPHQVMVGFLAQYESGDVRIDADELDDARWFHVDALPVIPPPLSIARRIIDAWAARLGRDTTHL
jgi:NAD+ diphosphatase